MRVYYDYQILCSQVYGGISRCFYELISRLNEKDSFEAVIKCTFSENRYFEKLLKKKAFPHYHWRIGELIKKVNKELAVKYLREDYDIIHPTGYDPYIFDCKEKKHKVVVTIHDMIQEKFSDGYYEGSAIITQKKRQIYEADHIIAVSNNTKKDILNIYPDIPEDKITVIYHGKSTLSDESPEYEFMNGIPRRYILYVGQRYSYKNFNRFVEAMKPLLEDDPELNIVCAGGGGFKKNELEKIKPNADRFIQKTVDDIELAYLYRNAICFVFPSLYEGFGLPILEAFNCGCPVLLSNTSSMPEIGGDAALYYDPYNAEDIMDKVSIAVKEENTREKLKKMGYIQANKFNWNITSEKVWHCYNHV